MSVILIGAMIIFVIAAVFFFIRRSRSAARARARVRHQEKVFPDWQNVLDERRVAKGK
ncbi:MULTISPECIES: hypothetical protein [unclassified Sphingomonas]|uniref:hypothetical protein n=1 Tax=unclassified Sphingomonas TaxID=196159 RepID=UPI0022699382|nr:MULTISPECIES: hypothetical protein [unclassified Sphingomonas]